MLSQDAKLKEKETLNMTSLEQTSTPGSFVHFTIHCFMQKQDEGKKSKTKLFFEAKTLSLFMSARVFALAEVLISDAAASGTSYYQ